MEEIKCCENCRHYRGFFVEKKFEGNDATALWWYPKGICIERNEKVVGHRYYCGKYLR